MYKKRIFNFLNELDKFLYSLIVLDKRNESSIYYKSIGESLIKLCALLIVQLTYFNDHSERECPERLNSYINEFFSDARYAYTLGYAKSIISENRKTSNECTKMGLTIADGTISTWSSLSYRWEEIKRPKELFFGKIVLEMEDCLFNLTEELSNLKKIKIERDRKVLNCLANTFPLNPMFYLEETNGDECILYAFESYNPKSRQITYVNWPSLERREIVSERIVDVLTIKSNQSVSQPKIGTYIGGRSLIPLFYDSYEPMVKLAQLLERHTEEETKEELWVEPYYDELVRFKVRRKGEEGKRPILFDYKNATSMERKRIRDKYPVDIQNLIIRDCVYRGPVAVLEDVDEKEKRELESYIKELLGKENFLEVENQIIEQLGNYGVRDEEKKKYRRRYMAIEVAKFLGFKICEQKILHGINYYSKEIEEYTSERGERKIFSLKAEAIRGLIGDICANLEKCLKEMLFFYLMVENEFCSGNENRVNERKVWEDIKWYSMGKIIDKLRELGKSENWRRIADEKLGRKSIINIAKFDELIKSGKPGDVVSIRNSAVHGRRIEYRFEESLRKINLKTCEEGVLRRVCLELFDDLKKIYEFLKDEYERPAPYKITFTQYSINHAGIQTCNYIADMVDDERSRGKIIYTRQEISFSDVYLCLPNWHRSNDKIWIDPILIKIECDIF